jgi:hypothetical protein
MDATGVCSGVMTANISVLDSEFESARTAR